MRTCFEIDERDEYHVARNLLVRRCVVWARERSLPADPELLRSALDSRHYSSDGRLTYWTPAHVRHHLLEWIPRYLDAEPEELAAAPEVLRSLLRFIADYGLRDPRGAALPDNEAAIDAAAREYPAALADVERYGVGKYWSLLARRHGVSVDDAERLAAFQRRARRERLGVDEALLARLTAAQAGHWQPGEERAPAQLPVALPDDHRLADAAATGTTVARVHGLIRWLGDTGRPVDPATGGLTGHRSRELVAAIGAGSRAEADLLVAWAKRARLVRRYRGRLVPVARARRVLADPIALWRRLFEAIPALGGRFLRPDPAAPPSALEPGFDEVLPDILSSLYSLPSPMPVKRLEETVWWHCCGAVVDIESMPPQVRRRQRGLLERDLTGLWDRLTDLGAVRRDFGVTDPVFLADLSGDGIDSPFDPDTTADLAAELRQPTELVRLTDLATFVLRDRMLAEGREAGLVGELAASEATEMLGVVTQHYPPAAAASEVDAWLSEPGRDLEALLDVARATPLRSRAAAILELLYDVQPGSAKLLRRVRSDPALAPAALVCLVETGILDLIDLTDDERQLLTAESSLRLMELDGPGEIIAGLEELPRHDARRVLHRVLTSGHPDRQGLAEFRRLVVSRMRRDRGAMPPGTPTWTPERLGATRRARIRRGGHG
ncbi:hypothetical protein [Stackebrandtia albiflava]|uniref:hypothetical protein n=1 Tax=Stackebrandtia albiflava TaxID=406432 RepID=UPI0011BFD552|nr:hypothetical protein [Stackebrandtia albiflava]